MNVNAIYKGDQTQMQWLEETIATIVDMSGYIE